MAISANLGRDTDHNSTTLVCSHPLSVLLCFTDPSLLTCFVLPIPHEGVIEIYTSVGCGVCFVFIVSFVYGL